MMISRVPPSALSDLHPAVRRAGPARPLARLQERGVAGGAAARGRRAAPHQSAASPGLGRPRCARRADPPPAAEAADAPAGHPGYRPAVAPPAGHPEAGLPEPGRPVAGQRRDRGAHRRNRRVAPVHCCTGAPSGPRMPLITARPKRAAWAVQVFCCSTVSPASRDGCFVRWQVACTRCVRLLRAALGVSWQTRYSAVIAFLVTRRNQCSQPWGDWGSWSGVSRSSPHRLHRPSCLDSRRTVQESSGGLTFWRRCARYPAGAGSSGDVPPLTKVCRFIAEYPLVVSELAELSEIPADDPVPGLVRVAPARPLTGELPRVIGQGSEPPGRHHRPVVGDPAPRDRGDLRQYRCDVGPAE